MLFLTFLVAVVVNFLGYIPLGNINLTAVQISINKSFKQSLIFISTFSVFEAFFTYLLMRFANWFAGKTELLGWINWVLIGVFIVLGTLSWLKANEPLEENPELKKRDSIKTGIILGIFNPMQIPFWTIAGTYLIANKWIVADFPGLEIFAFGAAIGAFLCLYLFARFASYFQEKFSLSVKVINKGIAMVFFILAAIKLATTVYPFISK